MGFKSSKSSSLNSQECVHSIFVAMCPAAGKHRSVHFHSRGSRLHVVAFVRCAHIACHRCLMNFFFHPLFQTGHPIVPVIPGRSVAIGKLVLLLFVLIGFDCMASLASTVLPLSWPHTYWVCSRGIRPVGVGEDPREPRIQYWFVFAPRKFEVLVVSI